MHLCVHVCVCAAYTVSADQKSSALHKIKVKTGQTDWGAETILSTWPAEDPTWEQLSSEWGNSGAYTLFVSLCLSGQQWSGGPSCGSSSFSWSNPAATMESTSTPASRGPVPWKGLLFTGKGDVMRGLDNNAWLESPEKQDLRGDNSWQLEESTEVQSEIVEVRTVRMCLFCLRPTQVWLPTLYMTTELTRSAPWAQS